MSPKVYSIDEHRIPPNKIDPHAFYVIEKLRTNGHLSFLVGGGVRDLLLNVRPKDFDISTAATPEEIKKIFRHNCILIGRRFRLAHIYFGKKVIEVATFRAGDTENSSLILRDNVWGSPQEDVLRRDFTINGLFYDPEVQTVIDYVGGFPDLERKILRTIGKSEVRFTQDPVRMIRLLKFKARFNFTIDDEAGQALTKCKNDIVKSSQARILEEIFRMLSSGFSKSFFELLQRYGFLKLLMPGLNGFLETPSGISLYKLLEQLDIFTPKHSQHYLDRSFLTTPLIFPILDDKIAQQVKKQKKLHLGIIAHMAKDVIEAVFRPFFLFPKKTKCVLIHLLVSQYRILPLGEVPQKKTRVPRDPSFKLALEFFHLRCMLNPDLHTTHTFWTEALIAARKKRKK